MATWIALNVQVTTRNGIRIYPETHEPCNNTENTENYETETTGKFRQTILADKRQEQISVESCKIMFLEGTAYSIVETLLLLATMYFVTDKWTDRQTDKSCQ